MVRITPEAQNKAKASLEAALTSATILAQTYSTALTECKKNVEAAMTEERALASQTETWVQTIHKLEKALKSIPETF